MNLVNILTTSSDIANHLVNTVIHITAAERTKWDGKQDAISDLSTIRVGAAAGSTAAAAVAEAQSDIEAIEEKIPTQATASNQLADKDFVNSTVATETASYISYNGQPFDSVTLLMNYSGTVTNNDYAFVSGTDTAGNVYFDRYKATVPKPSGASSIWSKEYRLNNSSFTSAQWAAISSGITSTLVTKLNGINMSLYRTSAAQDVIDATHASTTDAANLAASIANAYSASSTYAVGDYCTYGNKLYKCVTAIGTAEAWNASKWTTTSVCADLKPLVVGTTLQLG